MFKELTKNELIAELRVRSDKENSAWTLLEVYNNQRLIMASLAKLLDESHYPYSGL